MAELQQLERPGTGGFKEEEKPRLSWGDGREGACSVAQPALCGICFQHERHVRPFFSRELSVPSGLLSLQGPSLVLSFSSRNLFYKLPLISFATILQDQFSLLKILKHPQTALVEDDAYIKNNY